MPVNPIPEDYPRVVPHLTCDGAAEAITFYSKILGFKPRGNQMHTPEGHVAHAELTCGDSMIMVSDPFPGHPPRTHGDGGSLLMIYVDEVDHIYAEAVRAGAHREREPQNTFYGDRTATIVDPWGHRWMISSHVEDISPEEMAKHTAGLTHGGVDEKQLPGAAVD